MHNKQNLCSCDSYNHSNIKIQVDESTVSKLNSDMRHPQPSRCQTLYRCASASMASVILAWWGDVSLRPTAATVPHRVFSLVQISGSTVMWFSVPKTLERHRCFLWKPAVRGQELPQRAKIWISFNCHLSYIFLSMNTEVWCGYGWGWESVFFMFWWDSRFSQIEDSTSLKLKLFASY